MGNQQQTAIKSEPGQQPEEHDDSDSEAESDEDEEYEVQQDLPALCLSHMLRLSHYWVSLLLLLGFSMQSRADIHPSSMHLQFGHELCAHAMFKTLTGLLCAVHQSSSHECHARRAQGLQES